MPTDFDFDIQRALTDMESRLRTDIQSVGAQARIDSAAARTEATTAQTMANAAVLANAALNGRIVNLEEKAGWIKAGIGTSLVGFGGFVWHLITNKGH